MQANHALAEAGRALHSRRMISGWGLYPRAASEILAADAPETLPALLRGRQGVIARGGGRAYGDAAVGLRATCLTGGLDRMRGFDPATGRLRAEAGVTLADIVRTFLPRGFFPPVVPGTQFVTLGGMIASDVHGKNHHREGGFGAHVEALTLLTPDGVPRPCARDREPELFAMTLGGMGLTGTILDATFRLRPVESGWIRQETRVATDLAAMLRALDEDEAATYSVAWIDCLARGSALGRGLVYRGEHAGRDTCRAAGLELFPTPARRRLTVPPGLPGWTLNRASVTAFNALYFRRGTTAGGSSLVPWQGYFFPLDGLAAWNRLYGARGFVQHQCVVPRRGAEAVLAGILDRVARLGTASPLAVLKRLGPGGGGMSFPMEGYTLALDLPAHAATFALLDDLDRSVVAAGGRLYLAKDARQSRDTFEAGYPALPAFRDLRRQLGADGALASRLSARLGL
ncbi:FAD-binding oxidoreductase [Methylorubrum podarium]|uniref:FAD-binding oxidoreductase n=1 Tax=Methylorubrum podarium TaxID=200476 RepID=UPI001EE25727|nr:FAD-binding oxidoreductase [Methylorubrum podarium]GJE71147.1 Decaprenylphosphoryl-beta-D-ribose oxidase [Methylorubrum podarium]